MNILPLHCMIYYYTPIHFNKNTTNISYKYSWTARKILNCREFVLRFIRYHVGSNSDFLLWHDYWARNKLLLHISVISMTESTSLVFIDTYLRNRIWDMPSSIHVNILEIRHLSTSVQIFRDDSLTWDVLQTSNVLTSFIWSSFRSFAHVMP